MKWFCYGVLILFINVLTINGSFLLSTFLYSKVLVKCNNSQEENVEVSAVKVHFFDFPHDVYDHSPLASAADTFTASGNRFPLDVTKKLILFVPGYSSNITQDTAKLVQESFKRIPNINLMIVDHSYYTNDHGGKKDSYQRSVFYTYYIGQALGTFLVRLHELGYASNNIHAIGHSLGSHMLSYAGTAYTKATNEKIWRITGIDPAGPCFANCAEDKQIRKGVAEYVEVYHCNAGELGTSRVLADIDFFFNYEGRKQPNCFSLVLGKEAECSHSKCVKYWMDTVAVWSGPVTFLAAACRSYKDWKAGRCWANEATTPGYLNPGTATGKFYFKTLEN